MRFVPQLAAHFLCFFLTTGICGAADPETEKALAALQSHTASVASLRCAFTQTTSIPLFSDPVVSRGVLLFKKPDSLVWEYTEPVSQGLAFSGAKGFRWEEDRARRTPFTTAKDPVAGLIATQVLAWIRFDREWIEAQYAIQVADSDTASFLLTPKSEGMRDIVTSLRIRFADDGVAREIMLQEATGGQTVITLHDVAVNAPVADREFH